MSHRTTYAACGFGRSHRMLLATLVAVLPVIALSASGVSAQTDDKLPEFPEPKDMTLTTRDNVLLRCTYFAKPRDAEGTEVIPVILVHGWDGQRTEYDSLAKALQQKGCAVIVPDLRGHGESTRIRLPNGKTEQMRDRSRMRPEEIQRMVAFDLETVKTFLIEENNKKNLNIDLLCIVGAKEGAVVALSWAALDWSAPPLTTGKQGQYVKGYVLLSPMQSFKALLVRNALRHPAIARGLDAQIIVGRQSSKSYTDAKRLYTTLKNLRPRYSAPEDLNLYFEVLPTSLEGTSLLQGKGLLVAERIAAFIDKRIASKRDEYKWEERRDPRAG